MEKARGEHRPPEELVVKKLDFGVVGDRRHGKTAFW
jgi:hypothetical protein